VLVVFFATHPDALINVIFAFVVVLIFDCWLWNALTPKKRRRSPARRRR
jgi:hypothetical protein